MSEESKPAAGTGDDGDDPATDDAVGSDDSETTDESDDADVPGGSIHDYLDDDRTVGLDVEAPAGDTGTDDPVPEEEREAVSDAVGAPVPEEDLDEDPDLAVDPAIDPDEADAAPAAADTGLDRDRSVTVDGEPTVTPDPAPGSDEGLVGDAPPSDQEMPLADHIEEMVRRLAVVLVVAAVVAVAVFPQADQAITYLWNTHIPGVAANPSRRPRLYGPLELIVTELKVSALAGLVIGLPVFVYETYLFMRPGLFPKERRYYLAAVPTSLVLAFVGVAFAHFAVLPAIFAYFTSYTTGTAVVAFGLKETFGLILVLMGFMAVVFQIPLFIMLAIMMNLTTRSWLEQRRLLFWGAFLGIAFLVSPDPTGMAPIIVAATMIALFEGTLALLRWTGN